MSDDYKLFMVLHPSHHCWNCGRGSHSVPENWYGPWMLERSHIVSSPRKCDSRAVVALCSLCHRLSHGIKIGIPSATIAAPTVASMLWMKRVFDRERYDRAFLQTCCIGRLPRATAPPLSIQTIYCNRRGKYPDVR